MRYLIKVQSTVTLLNYHNIDFGTLYLSCRMIAIATKILQPRLPQYYGGQVCR